MKIIANVDDIQQVKKFKNINIDFAVSENIDQIEFINECEKHSIPALIYDESLNATSVDVENFYENFEKYKNLKSYRGNVIGFNLVYGNVSDALLIRNILAFIDNKKYAYTKFYGKGIEMTSDEFENLKLINVVRGENFAKNSLVEVSVDKIDNVDNVDNIVGVEIVNINDFSNLRKQVTKLKQ